MSADQAECLQLLTSASSIDRLRAARALDRVGIDAHGVEAVRAAAGREEDSWVRSALERVLSRYGAGAPRSHAGVVGPDEVGVATDARTLEDVRAQAIASVTRTLLHEIRPHVGYIDTAASRDVPSYEGSRTAIEVERLRGVLDTVARLSAAARPPEAVDFDMTTAILECVDTISGSEPGNSVVVARADPVPVRGDWGLLQMAFSNALRNALEASRDSGARVVVNWGVTDQDYWIAVLDEGVGLPDGRDLFEPGFTTKSRETNSGWGLAIAHQAIQSAGGEFSLRPRDERGTACEIRWARDREGL